MSVDQRLDLPLDVSLDGPQHICSFAAVSDRDFGLPAIEIHLLNRLSVLLAASLSEQNSAPTVSRPCDDLLSSPDSGTHLVTPASEIHTLLM